MIQWALSEKCRSFCSLIFLILKNKLKTENKLYSKTFVMTSLLIIKLLIFDKKLP